MGSGKRKKEKRKALFFPCGRSPMPSSFLFCRAMKSSSRDEGATISAINKGSVLLIERNQRFGRTNNHSLSYSEILSEIKRRCCSETREYFSLKPFPREARYISKRISINVNIHDLYKRSKIESAHPKMAIRSFS